MSKKIYYNKNEALYMDDGGCVHTVKRICPHMKCKLIFNEKELTWDCPCHGSRFTIDGKVINGPSIYDI
ncbi:MAG: Rieske 2Fe-2S domain-containing protein [Bacilli bacterium]|nr:Rieske 2Fe-2S domain-containing protein [Bacilli bacterium]